MTKSNTTLSYQTAEIFSDKEVRIAYLKDCGFVRPEVHEDKLAYLLNHLRVTMHIK